MIDLDFPGMRPAAKARPRYDGRNNRHHMPQTYLDWKRSFAYTAEKQFRAWAIRQGHGWPATIKGRCAVAVVYRTATGNMRPDVDNAAGAVLDGLKDAKVMLDDSQVLDLRVTVVKVKKADVGIAVTIGSLPVAPEGPQQAQQGTQTSA